MSSPYSQPTNSTTAGGGAGRGGQSSGGGNKPLVNDAELVYHVDLVVLALIALLVLLRLPRVFARWKAGELTTGHFLRNASESEGTVASQNRWQDSPKSSTTTDPYTFCSSTRFVERSEKEAAKKMSYPPHVAACVTFLVSSITPLRNRITPGFSVLQAVILLLYLSCLAYPSFYYASPLTNPLRAGWVSIAQTPFVFAYAAKNNVLGSLLGLGYEKLNFLHRFVGRLVVLAANVHAIGYFYKWALAGRFMSAISRPSNAWGLVGLLCFDFLFLFSTAICRKKAYNWFLATHVVSFAILLPACWLHHDDLLPYIYASLAVWGLDHLLRVAKTWFCTATIRPLPDLGITRIEIPIVNSGWRAGQHVRIRILSTSMGWWGWSEAHPFTIASATGGQEGLVLLCKKTGTWTNRLYQLANTKGGYVDGEQGRSVKVMIEGPYGGPGHAVFTSYSAALFIVGGSGIAFATSAVQELIRKDLEGKNRAKVVELVWIVQDPASLTPMLPLFTSMIQGSPSISLRISVHYTRARVGKVDIADFFHPDMTLRAGRPSIASVVDEMALSMPTMQKSATDRDWNQGLLVGVCGPVALADDVAQAVGKVEPPLRNQIGGIEIHEEAFGW